MLDQAPSKPLVPPDTIDVDGVGLGILDAHVESDVLALVGTGGGRITLDLAYRVSPNPNAVRRDVPVHSPRLLIFNDDGIALSRRLAWKQSDPHRCGKARSDDK